MRPVQTSTRVTYDLLTVLAFAVGALGCPPIDNSGGTAPDGDPLTFQTVVESLGVMCAEREDSLALLDDSAAVDDFLADCVDGEATVADVTETLDSAVLISYDGERELVVVAAFGGCLTELDLFQIRLNEDDPILRPWLLRGDESYEAESDCAAPDTQRVMLLRAADAGAATSASLTIGTYNPNLPGAPQPEIYD
jgi:hypothetical protein